MSTVDSNPPAQADNSSRRAIVGSIAVSIAFVMELTLVPMVLPSIQAHFDLSINELAWVFNAYGIAVAFGVLLGGWLGDVFGIRKVFASGVVLFAAGAAVVAIASSYEMVIFGRVLQGFGGGVFSPLVPLLLTRAYPHRPGKILIVWGSVTGYVAAFAPIVLSHSIADAGWQSAFVLFAIISVLALLVTGKMKAGARASIASALPNLRQLGAARDLWLVYGYIFFTYGAITFYLFRVPLWLAEIDYNLKSTGLILSMIWLSFSIGGTLLRNLVDGPRVRTIMLTAPLLIALSFPVAYFAGSILWFMVSAAVIGIGFACSNAPSTQMVLTCAPKNLQAISTSLDITFARLGGVMTVAFLAQSEFSSALPAILGMSLVAIVCVLFFKDQYKTLNA